MESMRLDKYLSNTTGESRTKIKDILKAGRVKVNSSTIKDAKTQITPGEDLVELDSMPVIYEKFRYYLLNKPAGCVSATKDRLSDTVLDFFKGENMDGFFPVGRLDKDSEGLLLITNDGMLAHRLLSPTGHVPKVYFVELDRELEEKDREKIENKIDIGDDKPCLPAIVKKKENNSAEITIFEGRFHQVKRMFAAAGYEVKYLKRIAMGDLFLDDSLNTGEYKKIGEEEISLLRKKV